MIPNEILAGLTTAAFLLFHLTFVARAILRPHREPASRVAWVVVIVILPVVGIIGYILLGETNIGRRRRERVRAVLDRLPDVADAPGMRDGHALPEIPEIHSPLFRVGPLGERLRAGRWKPGRAAAGFQCHH